MKWDEVFDESHPVKPATAAVIARFVSSANKPLSSKDIAAITRAQSNPFPKSDPLHAAFRPFDPSRWVIPSRPLPESYLDFLKWSNGGEFRSGERLFQFFPAQSAAHGVRAMLLAYHVPQYMPAALPFAFDGSGTFYLFDMRDPAIAGEYPIGCVSSGSLGWGPEEYIRIADSFHAACRGLPK
jgi:hypothetical protein